MLRQPAEIYPSTVRGGAPRPPAPAGAYADFVEAQLAASSDGSTDRAVSFWRRRLKGYATDSPLPRRLSEDAGAHGARRLEIDWPAEVLAGAQRLAARHGATLYMVLLSAFAALLHRLSGRDDLVVASPVTNREREEWESVVGYFVNLLPLRLRWPAETPFTELLAVTRETVIEAQTHQRLPIHQIAAAASLRPRALVHVLYQHVAAPRERIRAGGIVLTPKPIDLGRTRHDLTLSTFAAAGRLGGTLEYDRRALDDTSARQLVDALAATLEQVLDDPSVAPATLEIPHAWTREPEPPAKPAGRDDAPAPSTGAATSDLEARLAGIWQEVLEVEPVSRWDNFLDIGGDSLTAMQVIESVERSLGVRLAPGDLFTQTLAQLAASCERRRD